MWCRCGTIYLFGYFLSIDGSMFDLTFYPKQDNKSEVRAEQNWMEMEWRNVFAHVTTQRR